MVFRYHLLFEEFVCPRHLVDCKRALILKSMRYCLIQNGLGEMNPDGIILKCVNKKEANKLVEEFHSRYCGGHFAAHTTTHKILRVGYN